MRLALWGYLSLLNQIKKNKDFFCRAILGFVIWLYKNKLNTERLYVCAHYYYHNKSGFKMQFLKTFFLPIYDFFFFLHFFAKKSTQKKKTAYKSVRCLHFMKEVWL